MLADRVLIVPRVVPPLVCVPRRDVRVKGLAAATALVDAYGPESGPRSDILGVLEDFLAGGAGSALAASNEARLDHQVAPVDLRVHLRRMAGVYAAHRVFCPSLNPAA